MPKPPLRPTNVRGFADDDDEDEDDGGDAFVGGHGPSGRDELSRISEGSWEGNSRASSTYFSAASGAGPLASLASSLKLGQQPHHPRQQPPRGVVAGDARRHPPSGRDGAGGGHALRPSSARSGEAGGGASGSSGGKGGLGAASAGSGGAAAVARDSGAPAAENPEVLKQMIKGFVETGVRGRRLVAMRRDGKPQPVIFRLSREVDAFELAVEGGHGFQRVELTEVSSICNGGDDAALRDLSEAVPGLDASCAVVDLRDGRCITIRFSAPSEAKAFVRCMVIFAQEVQRERKA